MAVTSAPDRAPRVTDFARLKLRILGNSLRGQASRTAMFVIGALFGVYMAIVGFTAFVVAGTVDDAELRLAAVAFGGSGIVLSWILLPLVFFGVDETLDPARFALFPLRRRVLVPGMLAAAVIGTPAVATLLASSGLVVAGALRGGVAGAAAGLVSAAVGLLLCVVASRAVTSAAAAALRSRRGRDLALISVVVLSGTIGPLAYLMASGGNAAVVTWGVQLARVLGWTPLAAPHVAALDAADGRWGPAAARLAVSLASIALLMWWWSRTIESAMVGGGAGPGGGSRPRADRRPAPTPAVASLFPAPLRPLARTPAGALLARELRYWWRDSRRSSTLISYLVLAVLTAALWVGAGADAAVLPAAAAGIGVFIGTALANQFGADGAAYATNLVIGVPGRLELRVRIAGLALVTLPAVAAATTSLTLAFGDVAQLPAALAAALAGFAASATVCAALSVLAPYELPESSNPFLAAGGTSVGKSLLALVAMLAAALLAAPVTVAASVLAPVWSAVTLPAAIAWSLLIVALGTGIAGRWLDGRGPELLRAVTPRR